MTSSRRYSAPFFFNPAYDAVVEPVGLGVRRGDDDGLVTEAQQEAVYRPIVWGDFRMQRFAGDYSDQGKEIQIEDFKI